MASSRLFLGIDPSGGRHPFLYAALDEQRALLTLAAGDLQDVLTFLERFPQAIVAVNAPLRPNVGQARRRLRPPDNSAGPSPRGLDLRLAEADLRARGISIAATPSREDACPPWMRAGFDLYRRLQTLGFHPYRPDHPQPDAPRLWIETHPHACFCVLIGHLPLPKPTLEGRLQRQAVLYELGLPIDDPMDFFEEITLRRLRLGQLPMEHLTPPEHLDVLVAAYTAWLLSHHPEQTTCLGSAEEGWIVLPARELKPSYLPAGSSAALDR